MRRKDRLSWYYLQLNQQEEQVFQMEIDKLEVGEQETVMEIVTSWMQRGIEQGIEQGERAIVLRLLARRVGELPQSKRLQIDALSTSQLELLAEALLDFSNISDLEAWLVAQDQAR